MCATVCTTVHVCHCACVPLCVRLCMCACVHVCDRCATVHVALFEPMSKRHRLPLLTLSCASSVTVCCMCECAVKGDCVSGRVLVLRTPCYLSLYTQMQSCFPPERCEPSCKNHLMHIQHIQSCNAHTLHKSNRSIATPRVRLPFEPFFANREECRTRFSDANQVPNPMVDVVLMDLLVPKTLGEGLLC